MKTAELLISLIKSEITNEKTIENRDFKIDEVALYRLAKMHDLSHFLLGGLKRNEITIDDPEISKKIKTDAMLAVYRETRFTETADRIRELFNGEKIGFILLKGTVIRTLYPQSWMRTSCDVDVLVKEEDVERALKCLTGNGFLTDGKKAYHDYTLRFNEVTVELHFSILENHEQLDGLLSRVWEYAEKVDAAEYRETREFFAYHHIAHMAYHVLFGGCGIRTFLDLWIMRKKRFYDEEKLSELLKKADLTKFYETVRDLTDVWFSGKEHTELTEKLEDYILSGGVYGTTQNAGAMKIANNNGKVGYYFNLAFLPYRNMCDIYPVLKKHKWLLPFYYVRRAFSKLFCRKSEKRKKNVKTINTVKDENVKKAEELISGLGLKKSRLV